MRLVHVVTTIVLLAVDFPLAARTEEIGTGSTVASSIVRHVFYCTRGVSAAKEKDRSDCTCAGFRVHAGGQGTALTLIPAVCTVSCKTNEGFVDRFCGHVRIGRGKTPIVRQLLGLDAVPRHGDAVDTTLGCVAPGICKRGLFRRGVLSPFRHSGEQCCGCSIAPLLCNVTRICTCPHVGGARLMRAQTVIHVRGKRVRVYSFRKRCSVAHFCVSMAVNGRNFGSLKPIGYSVHTGFDFVNGGVANGCAAVCSLPGILRSAVGGDTSATVVSGIQPVGLGASRRVVCHVCCSERRRQGEGTTTRKRGGGSFTGSIL